MMQRNFAKSKKGNDLRGVQGTRGENREAGKVRSFDRGM